MQGEGTMECPNQRADKITILQSQLNHLKKENTQTKQINRDSGSGGTNTFKKSKPAWYLVKPTRNQPKEKRVDRKKWQWYPKYMSWYCHKPEDYKAWDNILSLTTIILTQ